MRKTIKILIACGSGIATSTIAAGEIKEICQEIDITSYEIIKCSMTEIDSLEENADIMFTTNNYAKESKIPQMSITGFITGINEEALKKQVREKILEVYKTL